MTPDPTDVALAVSADARRELPQILGDVERWTNMDSFSEDRHDVDALVRVIATRLEEYGLRCELTSGPTGLHLHARAVSAGPGRVVLLCHHDTVFPAGTAAARPFRVDGERATGPGVADMKGGIALAAHAVRLLARHTATFGTVEFVSVPDEETRTAPPFPMPALHGAAAILCMECGREDGSIVRARKGGAWLTLHARGKGAHPGVAPGTGRSALIGLCREALELEALHGARPGLTVEVTRLHAGDSVNAVPERGSLNADARAWTRADLDWLVAQVPPERERDGVAMSASWGHVPPFEPSAATDALVAAATDLMRALGAPPLRAVETGGVSDACWTSAAGLPTLDGLGPVGGADHGPDEYIDIGSIATRCGLLAGLIADLGAASENRKDAR
jgi:glutamate carboxypeptidase